MSDLLQNPSDTILISQLPTGSTNDTLDPEKSLETAELKGSETTLSTELINTSALSAIPLSLGDQQYTLIGTSLGVGGQTIQIPVVNIGNTSIALQALQTDHNTASLSQEGAKSLLNTHTGNVQTALQIQNETSITLADGSTASLSLSPDESPLRLGNQDQNSTLGLGDGDSNAHGIHNETDGDASLTLTNDTLTLSSQSLEISDLKMDEVLHGGHHPNEEVSETVVSCFTMKQDSSPRFGITTLENEINVAVDSEESF